MDQYAGALFYVLPSGLYHERGGQACGICKRSGIHAGAVQDFYPTPSTLSTCMFYTGIHPLTGEKVYVPRDPREKACSGQLMQYKNPANRSLVLEGFALPGVWIWVGTGPKCLGAHPGAGQAGGTKFPNHGEKEQAEKEKNHPERSQKEKQLGEQL